MTNATQQHKEQLTSREFFRSPARVTKLVEQGTPIVVTRRGERVFEVVPVRQVAHKTLRDFADLQFSAAGNADLSRHVDDIAYGA
jgi:prevent-host-death family protein